MGLLVLTTGGSPLGPGRQSRTPQAQLATGFGEAHAAIAGDGQTLVEAEARDLGARRLARLQQRVFRRDVDLRAVDDELGHLTASLSGATRRLPQLCRRDVIPTECVIARAVLLEVVQSLNRFRNGRYM